MKRLAILLILNTCTWSLYAQSAPEAMAQAKALLTVFDYSGALKQMDKAVKMEPQNTDWLLERANLQLLLERYKKAKEDFDAVVAIDSTDVGAWIGLAEYFRLRNQLDTAMKCAEVAQILAYDPLSLARAKIALAEVHHAEGRDSIATAYFVTSLEIDSLNVRALKKLAYLLAEQNRYEEANAYLMRAYSRDRFDLETLVNLAYTFNQMEYYRDAVEYSNLALVLDPQHPLILSNRAWSYLNLGMVNEAQQDIKRSLVNDSTNPMAHRYAGEIFIAVKDTAKACKSFKAAEKNGYSTLYNDGALESLLQQHCGN